MLMEAMLLFATLFWGLSFIWIKQVSNWGIDANVFLTLRYSIAALLILPFCTKELRTITRRELIYGLLIGVLMFLAMGFQTYGLNHTTPANSAFITTTYVVFVPFASWIVMRQRPQGYVGIPIALCVLGLYILTLGGGEKLGFNLGNLFTLVCAVAWAFQVTVLSKAGAACRIKALTILPLLTVTTISSVVTVASGVPLRSFIEIGSAWLPIVLSALFPTLLAGMAQAVAQRSVTPTRAAMIYSLESVFACGASALMGMDTLSLHLTGGGAMIVAAVALNELLTHIHGKAPQNAASHQQEASENGK